MMNDLKLDIGAGRHRIPGFIPIDRKLGHDAAELPLMVKRWHDDGLESEDVLLDKDSVSEIRASHVLEHLSFADAAQALKEWATILKPGGRMRIAVPDFDKISNGVCANDPRRLRYLMGGQTDEDDFHRSAWTRESLTEAMSRAGLTVTGDWKSELQDCAALPVSLNLEAVKGESQTATLDMMKTKVAAVASVPRLGFNDHWGCQHEALFSMGIPVSSVSGAFWGHCLQRGMDHCLSTGCDWILTLDYDTIFTARQIKRLFYDFAKHPEIDALAAMQPRRNTGAPLMTIKSGKGVHSNGSPLMCQTAHFGLTVIRASALRDVPKPWFLGVPGEGGSWDADDRIDDDIWFWKQWEKHGKTVAVAPEVRVGHLELVAAHYTDGGVIGSDTRSYISPREWLDQNGRRENISNKKGGD